jgi:integrase
MAPRYGKRPMTTWEPEHAQAFLESLDHHRFGVLFAFLLLTGTRRGEALGLHCEILTAARRASIVQSVTKIGRNVIVGPTKTQSGNRVVALDTHPARRPPSAEHLPLSPAR